jgi:sugar phosphate isomerase/epimerase
MGNHGATMWTLPERGGTGLRWAALAGYSLVHFDSDDLAEGVRHFGSSARAAGVSLGGISVVELERVGLGDLDAAFACVDRTLEIARRLAVPFVYLPAFGNAEILDDVDLLGMCQVLQHALAATAGSDVTIGTENVLPPDRLKQLFERVGDPRLRLLLDTQNPSLHGIDPRSLVVHESPRLGPFVHAKDGIRGLGDCCLGQGVARVAETMGALLSLGYSGTFVVETNYSDGDLDRVVADQRFLDHLIADAGRRSGQIRSEFTDGAHGHLRGDPRTRSRPWTRAPEPLRPETTLPGHLSRGAAPIDTSPHIVRRLPLPEMVPKNPEGNYVSVVQATRRCPRIV